MPRANRHYLPGYIWHITHRCHKGEFLLKFNCDKKKWIRWMYEAKQRFQIVILNYMLTSNHVHLLACCKKKENDIARAIHLASGRTAWEYNQRKNRKGSFWEDRYNSTAVENGRHLFNCMLYLDANIVRAGVVKHPQDWPYCGYQELVGIKQRYILVDKDELAHFLGVKRDSLQDRYKKWTKDYLATSRLIRESCWTDSIGVGSKGYVEKMHEKLGVKTKGRKVVSFFEKDYFELQESGIAYRLIWPLKKANKV